MFIGPVRKFDRRKILKFWIENIFKYVNMLRTVLEQNFKNTKRKDAAWALFAALWRTVSILP